MCETEHGCQSLKFDNLVYRSIDLTSIFGRQTPVAMRCNLASFPGFLRFVFFSLHSVQYIEAEECVPCILLNANRRTQNGGGLGTRLL